MADSILYNYEGLEQISKAADHVLVQARHNKIVIFEGELGAGKTTLIKAICDKLLVEDNVTSPTYSLVNEYETIEGEVVYHFDFYRIKSEREALDMGIEEYFDSGSYCFIEWPSRIATLLPEEYLQVEIRPLSDTSREILITKK